MAQQSRSHRCPTSTTTTAPASPTSSASARPAAAVLALPVLKEPDQATATSASTRIKNGGGGGSTFTSRTRRQSRRRRGSGSRSRSGKCRVERKKNENAANGTEFAARRKDDLLDDDDEDWLVDWRTATKSSAKKPASRGISPAAFHGDGSKERKRESRRRRRRGSDRPSSSSPRRQEPDVVAGSSTSKKQGLHVVDRIRADVLQHEKLQHAQQLGWRRSAFRTLTELRKWPVQDRAVEHYRQLLLLVSSEPRSGREDATAASANVAATRGTQQSAAAPTAAATTTQQESCTSSSSSSSSSSALSSILPNNEPKRLLRDSLQSPAKSRLKAQYVQEFTNGIAAEEQEVPALWCRAPRIFASEVSRTGKRRYWTGAMGRFADKYWRKSDPNHRHYYELIPERTPCRLYFDLEFSKACNLDICNDTAETLLDELFEELQLRFRSQFDLDVQRADVVDLDSSTPAKFSRHWIVHAPGRLLFAHTAAAGHFVKELIADLAARHGSGQLGTSDGRPTLQRYLFVNTNNSSGPQQHTCVVDLGVYTRNRLFRLLGSSKFGKPHTAALHIAAANQFPLALSNSDFYLPEMEEENGLGGNNGDGNDAGNNDLDQAVRKFVSATDWSAHAEALAQTLVVPINLAQFSILPFDDDQCALAGMTACGSSQPPRPLQVASRHGHAATSHGASPYPALDEFVLNVLGTRGSTGNDTIQGAIRAWSIDRHPDSGGSAATSITYHMSRNRYCECVGRAHKGNNIYWVVDLQLFRAVQGCHDPDCRAMRFRGTPVPLPDDVRDAVNDALLDEALATLKIDGVVGNHNDDPNDGSGVTKNNDGPKNDSACDPAVTSTPSSAPFSDEELLEAVLANPELFP